MIEDAQPNERSFGGKGAAIPMVRSAHWKTSTANYYQTPNYPGRTPAATNNSQLSGTYNSDQYQQRRSNYPHDTWQAKRRRIGHSSALNVDPGRKVTPLTYAPYPKARKNRNPEPTELLVELPPECRKGAPGCQKLRKQWIGRQIEEIQTNIGVKVQFCGYLENSARFTCRNDQTPVAEVIDSGSLQQVDVGSQPDTDMQDEIIISGCIVDVDAELDEGVLVHPSASIIPIGGQGVSNYYSQGLHPAEGTAAPPPSASETVEPLRVFSSGVLSLTPPTYVMRSLSPEARTIPSEAASIPEFTAVNDCQSSGLRPRAYSALGNISRSGIDTILMPRNRTQESSGVGQRPTNQINYKPQRMGAVSHTLDQYSPPSPTRNFTADGIPVQVPTRPYDKFRRVLRLATMSSVLNVSMRGAFDLVDVIPLRHRRTLKAPNMPGELVDDACLLQAGNSYLVVLGHVREQAQISWYRIPFNMDQCDPSSLMRPWNSSKKGGVSAITPLLQPLQFATGGYDHIVHLWEVNADLSTASPRPLAIRHNSQIQSLLAIQDTSHKLITAAADCNVHFWDLSSERVVNTVKTSNAPYHAHSTISPFCTLLEVAHRELQFEVRDHRLVPERPVQRFGYTTDNVHGRFIKGDTMSNLFACGGRDGLVRLWDTRHLKAISELETVDYGQRQKIIQVLFHQSHIIACSQNGQMCIFKHSI